MHCRTIVCGVTASMRSQRAASEAALLAAETGAELTYVHVVELTSTKERFEEALIRAFKLEMLVDIGIKILWNAERFAAARGVAAHKCLKKGHVHRGLKDAVDELDADLLVLGDKDGTVFKWMGVNACSSDVSESTALSA